MCSKLRVLFCWTCDFFSNLAIIRLSRYWLLGIIMHYRLAVPRKSVRFKRQLHFVNSTNAEFTVLHTSVYSSVEEDDTQNFNYLFKRWLSSFFVATYFLSHSTQPLTPPPILVRLHLFFYFFTEFLSLLFPMDNCIAIFLCVFSRYLYIVFVSWFVPFFYVISSIVDLRNLRFRVCAYFRDVVSYLLDGLLNFYCFAFPITVCDVIYHDPGT